MYFDCDYLIAFAKSLNSFQSSGALRFIDMAVKEGSSSNRQWRGAIPERLPSLVHHQDNDSILSRETKLESSLRLIPFRNESHGARGLNTQYDAQPPAPDDRSRICAWILKNDGNCNHGASKSCSTFTSVRTAAQALPLSELRWEDFEKLTRVDLEKACAAFFPGGWLARTDMFYIAV